MDAQRFDNLARTFASRLSRRSALRRAGVAASASLLAATGIRPDEAAALTRAQNDGQPLFTLIRRYTLNVPTGQVRQVMQQGYVDDACKAPGFVAFLTVEDEDGDFVTVAVFRSQNDLANFANAEANWIAQNLDNLLPAPDEAISGDTYVHGVLPQGFPNTCTAAPGTPPPPAPAGAPAQSTSAAAQPTGAPTQPTAVPSGPTPTPTPACTAQGCTCSTGTQAPCDNGLVCCPTTDLLGGPGVCQTEAVCYPNECRDNGRSCPRSCGTTEACPSCCSNYCSGDGVCDNPPASCTGENCSCTPGVNGACDDGLVCCQGTSSAGPTCATLDECASVLCTGQFCGCQGGVQGACNNGLVCCVAGNDPGGQGTCQVPGDCPTSACTSEGCACVTGTQNPCDLALVCCGTSGTPGGPGTCVAQSACGAPCTGSNCACDPNNGNVCDQGLTCCSVGSDYICIGADQCGPCTSYGCPCTAGTDGACNVALVCCSGGGPGSAGTCIGEDECTGQTSCTGQGCGCAGGVEGACDDGFICCQDDPSIAGGPGTCQPADACGGAPACSGNGADCSASCTEGVNCFMCCSGYCNAGGVCDDAPQTTCISDGVNCGGTCNWSDSCGACCSGFCDGAGNCNEPGASAGACGDEGCGCQLANPACVNGLVCCDDGSGVTGTCTTGC